MTKTNLQIIKEAINDARGIKEDATGVYRKWRDSYQQEIGKIHSNRNLTDEGKRNLREKMSQRKTVELMQISKRQLLAYNSLLDVAHKEADRIANAKPKAADPVKAERFDKSFGEVKTAVMLASPDKAIKILREFIEATDEPALIDRVRAEFAAVVAPVIAQAKPEQKHVLTDLFEHTRRKAKGEEALEAEQLVQTAEALKESRFYSPIVLDNAGQIHREIPKYLGNPDAFFEEFEGTERMNTSLRSQEEVIAEIDGEI